MRRVCLTWTAVAAVLLSVPIASAVAEDGKLSVTADKWVAYLYSTGRPLVVRGGKEPVNVAAGSYRIRFMVSSVKDDQTATISGMLKGTTEIKAGQTTEIKTGGPIEASIEAKVQGKKVSFNMSAKDAGGNAVSVMATEKGKPIKPKVEVVKGDKVVYSSTLEYG